MSAEGPIDPERVLERARQALSVESQAIADLIPRLGGDFVSAAQLILGCRGKLIITGIGKSGAIGLPFCVGGIR